MSRFRGIPAAGRQFTALNRALEHAFELMDHVWINAHKGPETLDFAVKTDIVICHVEVPPPPEGYVVLVEAWGNIRWTSNARSNFESVIEAGTRHLTENYHYTSVDPGGGGFEMFARATHRPTKPITYTNKLYWLDDETDFTLYNHGIMARYIVQKGVHT